jgi:coenzyme F420 hydrogenase subunit beta
MSGEALLERIVAGGLCHGCGTCGGVCPQEAVTFREAESGVYEPSIDPSLCTSCGLCLRVCPGVSVNFSELRHQAPRHPQLGPSLGMWLVGAMDPATLARASSGGAISAILAMGLNSGRIDGAVVTGMDPDHPLRPRTYVAREAEALRGAAGSKYCPVPANRAIQEILSVPGRYAFVGLPCHLHGLRKAEREIPELRNRVVLRLGLFCGQTLTFAAQEYLLGRYRLPKSDITSFAYRDGPWPGHLAVRFRTGHPEFSVPYGSYYDTTLCAFLHPRCSLCPDKFNELADLACGDAWFSKGSAAGKRSFVIARTPEGTFWLNNAAENGVVARQTLGEGVVRGLQGDVVQTMRWRTNGLSARLGRRARQGMPIPK